MLLKSVSLALGVHVSPPLKNPVEIIYCCLFKTSENSVSLKYIDIIIWLGNIHKSICTKNNTQIISLNEENKIQYFLSVLL